MENDFEGYLDLRKPKRKLLPGLAGAMKVIVLSFFTMETVKLIV